jgi:AcrR family transcriptional regulator
MLFAERGFQATTIRAIAAQAGVNTALVHHYFGTKEQLFIAALRLPINPAEVIEELLASGPRAEFAERFARFFIAAWRDPVSGQALQAVLRRATSDEESAALVRNLAENVLLDRAAAALGVSKLRVAAAMSQLIGLVLGATIIRIDPLASASDEELAELITPALRGYLTEAGN